MDNVPVIGLLVFAALNMVYSGYGIYLVSTAQFIENCSSVRGYTLASIIGCLVFGLACGAYSIIVYKRNPQYRMIAWDQKRLLIRHFLMIWHMHITPYIFIVGYSLIMYNSDATCIARYNDVHHNTYIYFILSFGYAFADLALRMIATVYTIYMERNGGPLIRTQASDIYTHLEDFGVQ